MTRLRPAVAFTAVVLRSLVRDRTALFFYLVLPVAVIVIIGATFGGQERLPVGIAVFDRSPAGGLLDTELRAAEGIRWREADTVADLAADVRRRATVAGVVVPADAGEAGGGRTVEVGFVTEPTGAGGVTARLAVEGAVGRAGARVNAAAAVASATGLSAGDALAAVLAVDRGGLPVETVDVGDTRVAGLSRFSLTAPQNLVLFVFINAMASAAFIVIARRAGVLRRAMASPSPLGTLLAGLGVGWYVLALVQSLLIVVVGAVAFGVSWGDPVGAAALVAVYALVGCGAGLLVGAIGRDEDRVSAISPIVGIVLGALGGCMVPLEVFPPTMAAVARVTPHYWAVTAWQRLIFDGVALGGIAGPLAVLAAFAVTLTAVATVLLRRELTGGSAR